jgi:hypothetical protein
LIDLITEYVQAPDAIVYVIVTDPGLTPVTRPALLTVAIELLLLDHPPLGVPPFGVASFKPNVAPVHKLL